MCVCETMGEREMGILGALLGNGFVHLSPLLPHPEVTMEACREVLI